ncbi:MAG: hypothetical protein PWR03_130 [Tenuifilum sp.]|uniref:hypothetical protein n=1 Tax=Tenuifilum sp. TaxID=2760880 RepID=UPI0024AC344B|nr:hypothetical protein [Tenuifilum sp.]MDI3525947.1 hypothetical protein [Tenuifilum sp.]
MIAIFKFIVYFTLALFLLGLVGRLLLRFWLNRIYKRMNPDSNSSTGKRGSNIFSTAKRKKKIIDKNQGEYIEYEEVE